MNKSVIVIGGNHHNTLGVIRALGYKGVMSYLLLITEAQNPYVSYSRFIAKKQILKSKEDIVPYLLKLSKENKEKSVIISCADFVTSELDKAFDSLKDKYYLPTAKEQGVCNHYMDKDAMAELAMNVGIGVPQSWIVENGMYNICDMTIPCIVKPLASIYGSKAEIKICRTKEQLMDYLDANKDHRFIVQEFIEKDFEYQLIGCSLNHGDEIVIPGYSKCIRPCPGTNTGFLEYKPFGNFNCDLKACRDFIKAIGYQGLFSMEYLRDRQGNDYFMEINMRNDGNAICVTGAGVNLPYIWYQYCVGNDYKAETINTVEDIFVMPEIDDFRLMLKGKVSLRTWLRDYKRTTTFMEYSDKDPMPFKIRRKQFILDLIHKIVRV